MNIIWATGGGAINVIFERMGGVYFAEIQNWNPDLAVAFLWTAGGLGLFVGMFVAHRTEAVLERRKWHSPFIVWTLILHGVLFAVGGYMPSFVAVRDFRLCFACARRCRICRAGNAFSEKSAGLYSRANFNARPRRGDADLRNVQLFFERVDALHFAANADRYFGNFFGVCGRGLVFETSPRN